LIYPVFKHSIRGVTAMPKSRKTNVESNIIHRSFEIGILTKGIDGVLEVIGGTLLVFLSPGRLNRLVHLLTQHELSEDPRDMISNYLIRMGSNFSISTQHFGVFYLMSHGLVKIILVILLWKRKLWAYPLAVAFLILFIIWTHLI
jgi:uncharacterized membrane protein